MIKESVNGFCMALADSVPGVSGGTIAFIMGFYDSFIGSIHDLVFGSIKEKRRAIRYLVKLGIGWVVGMVLAALILSNLFESHIYVVSSLFIGFIVGSIPIVIKDEMNTFSEIRRGILFLFVGIVFVVGVTALNSTVGFSKVNLSGVSTFLGLRLFLVGMIAIVAMFLPGISGSTLLLIFGMYVPIIQGIKSVLTLNFACFPSLLIFGLGVLFGMMSVVKMIRYFLKCYRVQTMYLILGMMVGSLYSIVMGPTTLEVVRPSLSFQNFDVFAAIIGFAIVYIMHKKARC